MITRRHRTLLEEPPNIAPPQGIELRCYRGLADIAPWLALRAAAFAGLTAPGRPWSEREFRREFLDQPWWQPERLILAESTADRAILGTVALRPAAESAESIHWLMVAPNAQRRGLGRTLLRAAELLAWSLGTRRLTLETLSTWPAAPAFYAACGYLPDEKA